MSPLESVVVVVVEGAVGEHVYKIQTALMLLDNARIDAIELQAKRYGWSTAAAVLHYKRKRDIVNSFQYLMAADVERRCQSNADTAGECVASPGVSNDAGPRAERPKTLFVSSDVDPFDVARRGVAMKLFRD